MTMKTLFCATLLGGCLLGVSAVNAKDTTTPINHPIQLSQGYGHHHGYHHGGYDRYDRGWGYHRGHRDFDSALPFLLFNQAFRTINYERRYYDDRMTNIPCSFIFRGRYYSGYYNINGRCMAYY